MWADEINDPEYQDLPEPIKKSKNTNTYFNKKKSKDDDNSDGSYIPDFRDLFYQPITSLNRPILNAITGEKSKYLIGSNNEKRFYCVMTQDPFEPKESCRLFFSNPQEYERFSGIKVSDQSIKRFNENQRQFLKI
jgi:hypothetical protein